MMVVLDQKGDTKVLRLELVLVYYLDEKESLMMKLDQVSDLGGMCGINV